MALENALPQIPKPLISLVYCQAVTISFQLNFSCQLFINVVYSITAIKRQKTRPQLPHFSNYNHVQDASTWTLPHGVTLSRLKSRLSSAGTHPIFLLTNQSLVEAYEAFVREIGFGTALAFDPAKAMSESYNDFYLPRALADGLKVHGVVKPPNATRRSKGC